MMSSLPWRSACGWKWKENARQIGDRTQWHMSPRKDCQGLEDREVPAPGGSWEGFLEEEEVRLGWEGLAPWPLELFP